MPLRNYGKPLFVSGHLPSCGQKIGLIFQSFFIRRQTLTLHHTSSQSNRPVDSHFPPQASCPFSNYLMSRATMMPSHPYSIHTCYSFFLLRGGTTLRRKWVRFRTPYFTYKWSPSTNSSVTNKQNSGTNQFSTSEC